MSFHTLVYHEVRKDNEWPQATSSKLISQNSYAIEIPIALFVTEDQFHQQIDYLVQENFHFLTMSEVKEYYELGTELPEKSILITFDDAYQSLYYNAYPILKEYGINVLLFLVSSWIFKESSAYESQHSKVMSWDQLIEIKDVFEIANHTNDLHNLVAKSVNGVMTASFDELAQDIHRCNQWVDYKDTFAYPFGFYKDEVIQNLTELGIKYAFTTQAQANRRETDTMRLNRFLVHNRCQLEDFILFVNSK